MKAQSVMITSNIPLVRIAVPPFAHYVSTRQRACGMVHAKRKKKKKQSFSITVINVYLETPLDLSATESMGRPTLADAAKRRIL